jgi:DNA replication protein DnaC
MVNLAVFVNDIQTLGADGRSRYINDICRNRLIVFDDLGAERNTDYAREQVYNVINARWESGRPFIVTTNLSLNEMKMEQVLDLKRIYDRVLDMYAALYRF